MPIHKNDFLGNNMITRFNRCAMLGLLSVFLLISAAWGGGVWLYEG
jgi:hypothetical protein